MLWFAYLGVHGSDHSSMLTSSHLVLGFSNNIFSHGAVHVLLASTEKTNVAGKKGLESDW